MLSVLTQWAPEQRADIMGMLPREQSYIGYIREPFRLGWQGIASGLQGRVIFTVRQGTAGSSFCPTLSFHFYVIFSQIFAIIDNDNIFG